MRVAPEIEKIDPEDPWGEKEQPGDEMAKLQNAASAIVDRLQGLVNEAITLRAPIEARWIEDLRAFQGRYSDDVEKMFRDFTAKGATRARAFIGMARSKTNIWEGRLSELLFPSDDKNWGISPTPSPEITDEARAAIAEAERLHAEADAQTADGNNAMAMENPEMATTHFNAAQSLGAKAVELRDRYKDAQAIMDEARKRSDAMSKEIEDQLSECDYGPRSRDVIRDACRLGVGVTKGPVVSNRPRRKWSQTEVPQPNGQVTTVFALSQDADDRPEAHRVDPWHFFPDPNATKMIECEYTLERHLPTTHQLRMMAKSLGFFPDAVREVLKEGAVQNLNNDLRFLAELRSITNEGQPIKNRYVMWEYNGPLLPEEIHSLLRAAGQDERAEAMLEDINDPLQETMVTIWFCNGKVLKIAEHYLLDSGETLYSVFAFDPGEASIMGARGVPNIMHDTLKALNSAWRQMLDNSALAAQPQVVVDKTQIEPEDGSWRLTPGKVWTRTSQEVVGTRQKPFEVFEVVHNQASIAAVIELALKFLDEETGLPLIAQGEQDQHTTQTFGGMAMLYNSANVVFRRVVKNWDDDITVPLIRRFYDWNMQFNQKEEIKGDMQTEARGTSVLLAQEMQAQNLMLLATNWSVHPILKHALRGQGYQAAMMSIQAMRISKADIMVSEEDFMKSLAAEADAASQQQSPDVIRAQATLEAAKITAQSRQVDNQTQLQIADIHRETELIKLAEMRNMSVEDLRTKLAMKKMDNDSKERIFAAETAVQAEQAKEARAAGDPTPKGGGGYV